MITRISQEPTVKKSYASAEVLESNLQKLRTNVTTLEDDLRHFELLNNANIRQQQVDSAMVGMRKQELEQMRGRINALLRTEKDRVKELHDTIAKAKENVRCASERKKIRDEKLKRVHADEMKAHMTKFRAQSQRHNTQLSVYEAKQDMFDYNRLSQMEAKKFEQKQKCKMRQLELNGKIKNMQNVIKGKMYELAMIQSNKSQLLLRKVEVSKRLKKKQQKNKDEFVRANVLMSYSLDVENAIKSNIEMTNQLKEYYVRVCKASKLGCAVNFEGSPELVAEQLGFKFNQVPIPSDLRVPGARLLKPQAIVGHQRYPTEFIIEQENMADSGNRDNSGEILLEKQEYQKERSRVRSRTSQRSERQPIRKRDQFEGIISDSQKHLLDIQMNQIEYKEEFCGLRVEKKKNTQAIVQTEPPISKDPFKAMAGIHSPVRNSKQPTEQYSFSSVEKQSEISENKKIGSHLSHEEDLADKFYMRGSDGFKASRGKKRMSSAHE